MLQLQRKGSGPSVHLKNRVAYNHAKLTNLMSHLSANRGSLTELFLNLFRITFFFSYTPKVMLRYVDNACLSTRLVYLYQKKNKLV